MKVCSLIPKQVEMKPQTDWHHEPSTSEWASLVVLVKKKDGTWCFCVDYKSLNSVSCDDAYPMPKIDDLIDHLGGAKFIMTLDLTRGYWHVPVSDADSEKTSFATPFRLYQFRVMTFGFKGTPTTFQRMMNRHGGVRSSLLRQHCHSYFLMGRAPCSPLCSV